MGLAHVHNLIFCEMPTVPDTLTMKNRQAGIKCRLDVDFLNLGCQNSF